MDDANKEVIDLNDTSDDGSGDDLKFTDGYDMDRAKTPSKKPFGSKRKVRELQDSDFGNEEDKNKKTALKKITRK